MKKIILAISVFLLIAGVSQADTITQTNSFDGIPNFERTLTFDQFDDNGGAYTLDSIDVRLYLTTLAGAILEVDNEDETETSGTVSYGTDGTLSSTDVGLISGGIAFDAYTATDTFKLLSLSPDDGDDPYSVQTDGGDYGSLTTVEQNDSASGLIDSSAYLGYIGNGTYDIIFNGDQEFDLTALGGVSGSFTPLSANGRVEIEYTYTIPEPATASLIMLAGLIAFLARRHVAK